MRELLLIKHAAPLVVPGTPPEKWRLSDRGIEACAGLAQKVRPHAPKIILTSDEPKAIQTGEIVAGALGIEVEQFAGLHEHDRSNVPHMRSGEFISHMELFFRRPNERMLGRESAEEAFARFSAAVEAALSAYPGETIAIVSHGTVLALWLAPQMSQKPFELWRRMGLPSMVAMELPDRRIIEVVDRV